MHLAGEPEGPRDLFGPVDLETSTELCAEAGHMRGGCWHEEGRDTASASSSMECHGSVGSHMLPADPEVARWRGPVREGSVGREGG